MRRAVAIAATLVAGLIVSNPLAAGRASRTVDVGDDYYLPLEMTIKEDTIIRFNWIGVETHNVQWESGPGPYFSSDNFEGPGIHYSRKFKKPGRYTIGCFLHEDMDMFLRVKRRRN